MPIVTVVSSSICGRKCVKSEWVCGWVFGGVGVESGKCERARGKGE